MVCPDDGAVDQVGTSIPRHQFGQSFKHCLEQAVSTLRRYRRKTLFHLAYSSSDRTCPYLVERFCLKIPVHDLELDRRFIPEGRMSAHGIIEPVNIFANGFGCVISVLEYSAPDQFRLDRFEDGFHHCIVIAISFSTHGWKHFVSFEDFAILITGILASPVRVLDQPRLWLPDCHSFL